MQFTPEQVKGRIKNVAKQTGADARVLMRVYMMERFLERIANSEYRNNFVIKGGILVTSMVGVSMRSTMDIDTSVRGRDLTVEEARRIISEIKDLDVGDGVTFEIKEISSIMDDMEYPGVRFALDALFGKMNTPIKIDISTGDVITPQAVEYHYKLMLEDRYITLWSYNLETILSEKLQTILARGVLNTRMRDFYDVRVLLQLYVNDIDADTLSRAFEATCRIRGTDRLLWEGMDIIESIFDDEHLKSLWMGYREKYPYAREIQFEQISESIRTLWEMI